jgi:hypothetical protein
MLERLDFKEDLVAYLTRVCGIDSLEEFANMDGEGHVETNIKGVTNMGGTVTVRTETSAVTPCKNGITV